MKPYIPIAGRVSALLLLHLTAVPAANPQTQNASPTRGLNYDKMVYLVGDSIFTVPAGYLWRVQAILSSDDALKEDFGSSVLSGMRNESETSVLARAELRLKSLVVAGRVFYVSGFPFDLDQGTKVSAGTKKAKVIVISQFKIE